MDFKRLRGYATPEGTDKYYRRAMNENEIDNFEVHHENFRSPFNSTVKVSSLGIGSYIGEPDDWTDYELYDAIKQSVLSGGINHIDTAPNYRYMKSEKTIGKVLTTLESKYEISRDMLFVASKAGYIPEDAENEVPLRQMIQRLIEKDGVPEDSIVTESAHCMHPRFLQIQLEESLKRLNLECLDVLYLQNPYEAQGPQNTENVFFDRLAKAFEFLESMVEAGKIRQYGLATYSSLRVKPTEAKMHLNLQRVARTAQKVVGEDRKHNFKFVQAPCSILMPEAFIEQWQPFEDDSGVTKNKLLCSSCTEQQLNLVLSQPLAQGMTSNVPLSKYAVPGVFNIPARHLQLIRSIPAQSVLGTVVGMKQQAHVHANLEIVKKAPMTKEEFFDGIKPVLRQEFIEDVLEM